MADYAVDKILGAKSFGYSPTPAARAVETTGDVIGKIIHGKKTQDKLEAIGRSGSYLLPYPDQLNAWMFNAADIINGRMNLEPADLLRRRPKKERHK
jgi:hypothetical protein